MYGHQKENNTLIHQLEELFTESISNELLSSPILWGQHTFSKQTINSLTIYYDDDSSNYDNYDNNYNDESYENDENYEDSSQYIEHPYTRNILYINKIQELPENIIINNLIVIFLYCKTIESNHKMVRNIMVYFIKCLLIQQKNIHNTAHLLNLNNEIQDLLLKNISELLKCTKEVVEILSGIKISKNIFNPSNFHLNEILFMAIKQNNIKIANLLLSQNFKIDVNTMDSHEKTSLFWASYHGQQKTAKTLLDLGANANAQDLKSLTAPLFLACYNGQPEFVKLLITYSADLDLRNSKNQTGLYWACKYGQHDIVKILIQNNASVDVQDIKHQTPLKIAYKKKDLQLAEILIDEILSNSYTVKEHQVDTKILTWVYDQQKETVGIKTSRSRFGKKKSLRYLAY